MIDRILDYDDVADAGPDGVTFIDATFKLDFGPWKAGQKVSCISLDDDKLIEWTADGKIVVQQQVKMIPVEDE